MVSILYFVEKYVDRSQEEYPEISSEDSNHASVFEALILPTSTTGVIVPHAHFTLSYHEAYEQAEWVAYELRKEHLRYQEFERPYFVEDRDVATGSADWRNYKNSGYDRGHLCPAGDRRFDYQAYLETFLTSNIAPQDHDFNSGIWNALEKQVRRWAKKKNRVYVITGGILKQGLGTIGSEQVAVPNEFYKIVAHNDGTDWQVIAFLIPNKETEDSYRDYVTTIDAIESLSGIDFFESLPDSEEQKLESKIRTGAWF